MRAIWAMRGQRAWGALLWLALSGWLLTGLAGCAPSLAPGSAHANGGATPTATPPPTLPLPPMLGAYHLFVSDLVTGDVYSLGEQSYRAARSTHGLGLSPDGKSLYVTDSIGDQLLVFHLSGGQLSDEHAVHVGAQPVHMVASPDGRYAYAACYLGAAVAIIDIARQALVGTIALPSLARPYGLSISRDGRYLYASDNFSGRIFTLDTLTRRAITSTQVGLRPALIARSPDGTRLYVANGGSRDLSTLDIGSDPAAPRLIATTPLEGYPHGVSVTPDGRYVAVADTVSGDVTIVDTLSHELIATVTGMKYPNDTLALAA